MTLPSNQDWNELHLSENPAVELLQALGYTYVAPEVLDSERPLKETILTERLTRTIKKVRTNLPIQVPDIQEQAELADIFDTIDTRLGGEHDVLAALQTLKSALMSVLLTGEVRVQPDSDTPSISARSQSVEASS
jgi:hypothetical protein